MNQDDMFHDREIMTERSERMIRRGVVLPVLWLGLMAVSMNGAMGADEPGIAVPPGFRVQQFADDDLAQDIQSLTFDGQGRVVVSGPGYVRILIDTNNDGRADTFREFAGGPKTGAQGMYFHGSDLLCSGDDGVLLYRDQDQNDRADGDPTTILSIKAGGEHDVHSIQHGPDGWWYVIAGNGVKLSPDLLNAATSPVKEPQAGILFRMSPDFKSVEVLADGFRNAYDFAFSLSGDLFTFDSDGERDVSLPWYRPCRVFHVSPGSSAGWFSRSWKRPNDFPLMPNVVAEFGRGSPTGVVCYRHQQFPSRFIGTLFTLDWTFGRILAVPLEENQGDWRSQAFPFATGTGHFGFAPTDLDVGPDGSLYVSVGGRGSRGGVFRIFYSSEDEATKGAPTIGDDPVREVLTASQPFSSWSRKQWEPMARQAGPQPFQKAALDEGRSAVERVRAIEVLTEIFGGPDDATQSALTSAHSVPVRARAAWALGRTKPPLKDLKSLDAYLNDESPLVQRSAMEAILSAGNPKALDVAMPRIAAAMVSSNRAVANAAMRLLPICSNQQIKEIEALLEPSEAGRVRMWLGRIQRNSDWQAETRELATRRLQTEGLSPQQMLETLRLLQISLGDVGPAKDVPPMFESYTARSDVMRHNRVLGATRTALKQRFPSGHATVNRELLRTMAMVEMQDAAVVDRILSQITSDSLPADDIDRLVAVAGNFDKRTRPQSMATAAALVGLDAKIQRMGLKQDANWDARIGELFDGLLKSDSAMTSRISEQSEFGWPGHVVLINRLPESERQSAIDAFAKRIAANADFEWTTDVVRLLGSSLNPEHLTLLRTRRDDPSVEEDVLLVLSKQPKPEDRTLFVRGLDSTSPDVTEASLAALKQLPRNNAASEQYALLSVARRL
ncbi:MAG: hypothetical protein KDA81_13980, partial [Planctomycetaceae bacterium]|nr:hypothetical protein [Planctomycetaceae bacterium]